MLNHEIKKYRFRPTSAVLRFMALLDLSEQFREAFLAILDLAYTQGRADAFAEAKETVRNIAANRSIESEKR